MKHPIVIACIASVILAASATAAGAITLNGRSLDGEQYGVTLYSSLYGIQEGRVVFLGDHGRVYLSNGMFFTVRLQGDEIGDPNFISATGLDGQAYRLQLKGSLTPFGPSAGDAGDVGAVRPHPGPH
jgi:hypothetical protein